MQRQVAKLSSSCLSPRANGDGQSNNGSDRTTEATSRQDRPSARMNGPIVFPTKGVIVRVSPAQSPKPTPIIVNKCLALTQISIANSLARGESLTAHAHGSGHWACAKTNKTRPRNMHLCGVFARVLLLVSNATNGVDCLLSSGSFFTPFLPIFISVYYQRHKVDPVSCEHLLIPNQQLP